MSRSKIRTDTALSDLHGYEKERKEVIDTPFLSGKPAAKADAYAIRRSGYSPRVVKQFVESLKAAEY